jgi:hypothetical protein
MSNVTGPRRIPRRIRQLLIRSSNIEQGRMLRMYQAKFEEIEAVKRNKEGERRERKREERDLNLFSQLFCFDGILSIFEKVPVEISLEPR